MSSIFDSIAELRKCQWYWGSISSREAENLLAIEPPGTFLVRDSRNENYIYSLTFKTESGPHSLIKSQSIIQFIEKTIEYSKNIQQHCLLMHSNNHLNNGAEQIFLLYPLKRTNLMPSLKYWCRISVRNYIHDVSKIKSFPLPTVLQKYLMEKKYLMIS
ncbi:LP02169p [Strongyloides ratti]|uniref:LP02169p n=1 Tax=Strongyloides ratti TaxID=34506 RepID=A0A090MYP2_STRRB|nr:LP02169p [Strongyloides ratti]CEF67529.1 LP02169p [Strongyloides ratti]